MSELINGLDVRQVDQKELEATNPDTGDTLYLNREDLKDLLDTLEGGTPPLPRH